MALFKVLNELQLAVRKRFYRERLKAANRIHDVLPFDEIEKKYIGRGLNYQIYNWRTLFEDKGQNYSFFESRKEKQSRKIGREPVRRVFLGNDALVFSDRGTVCDTYYNAAVLESLETWGGDTNSSARIKLIQKKPKQKLNGLTVSLLTIGADSNYAHFLFDGLSRLALTKEISFEPNWYLVSGPEKEWKKKILSFLGILDKVVWVNGTEEVQCDQLLFTSRLSLTRHATPYAARAVRNLFFGKNPIAPAKQHRIIYASRKSSTVRATSLEDRIHELLPKSVEVIEFETLSMEETIRVCSECKLFFGIHGAAFSNIIFCAHETRVVEFQLESLLSEKNQNYFQTICETLSLNHSYQTVNEAISHEELKERINKIIQ